MHNIPRNASDAKNLKAANPLRAFASNACLRCHTIVIWVIIPTYSLLNHEQIRGLLNNKVAEYKQEGEHDFDGMTKLEGYIRALIEILQIPEHCSNCTHHQVNHDTVGLGKCIACDCNQFKYDL